ncbi:hypothetical protein [Thermobrachium celere]|uniref:hypothetical protein n=1 Tax=Thermobrachium celere TaxID=53422 RepID=UPI001941F8E1|nr:hypothetical protein [Thermobrachium celere]GFR34975.1 hypothetical protein TCEA9_07870 [Thermobrachium celere]
MNLIEQIYNVNDAVNNKAIDKKGFLVSLNYKNYEFLYRSLKNKNNSVYIDNQNEVSFVIKLNKIVDIKEILYYKKSIDVKMDLEGPVIELIVDGLSSYEFLFNLNDRFGVIALKSFLTNKQVNVHFVVETAGILQKFYSSLMPIDDKVIERVEYVLKCLNDYCYPKIEEDVLQKESVIFEVESDYEILNDLINIIEALQKWNSKDIFSIVVDKDDKFKIHFVGEFKNKNYFKTQLEKNYSIKEYNGFSKGKKFLKYDRGMIYFYI